MDKLSIKDWICLTSHFHTIFLQNKILFHVNNSNILPILFNRALSFNLAKIVISLIINIHQSHLVWLSKEVGNQPTEYAFHFDFTHSSTLNMTLTF
jgi:hypothetical protein